MAAWGAEALPLNLKAVVKGPYDITLVHLPGDCVMRWQCELAPHRVQDEKFALFLAIKILLTNKQSGIYLNDKCDEPKCAKTIY